MLEEIKRIKLEEFNSRRIVLEEKENEIRKKLQTMNNELWKLKWEQSNGITVRSEFSFFEKFVTKRSQYKRFKMQSQRLSEVAKLIEDLKKRIKLEEKNVERELEISGISAELMEIKQKIELFERAQTLYEIGISPIDAMAFLESKGIIPVLTESDKVSYSHQRDYSLKSSLIGVHKTKYIPMGNMIKTAKDSNAEMQEKVTLNGTTYEYSYTSARDTIHMAMNDEVSSHMYGSWEDCKYAILIPFDDIPNEKIGRAAPMDTFTRGSLKLSKNVWILCPKDEVERIKKLNPNVHVLGYEGENVKDFSQPFLTQLGYRAEDVGMWNWMDDKSAKQFDELMQKEGIKTGTHTYTYFHEDELVLTKINQAISLCKLLRDNHLITNLEEAQNIMNQLSENHNSLESILSGLGETTGVEKDIDEYAIKGKGKHVDIFIEEMKKNGFDISPVYQSVMKLLGIVSIYNCNKDNADIIFNIPEEASETEKKVISELRAALVSDRWIDPNDRKNAFDNFITVVLSESIVHSHEREVGIENIHEEK